MLPSIKATTWLFGVVFVCGLLPAFGVRNACGRDLTEIAIGQTPEHEIRFRSGEAVYVEALVGNRWASRLWNAEGRDDLPRWSAAEPAFSITIKDDPKAETATNLDGGWQWVSGTELPQTDRGVRHYVVELSNTSLPVQVKVHTLLDGTPVLTRCLEITNKSGRSIALTALSPWAGRLWTADAPVTLGHAIRMTVEESTLRPRISRGPKRRMVRLDRSVAGIERVRGDSRPDVQQTLFHLAERGQWRVLLRPIGLGDQLSDGVSEEGRTRLPRSGRRLSVPCGSLPQARRSPRLPSTSVPSRATSMPSFKPCTSTSDARWCQSASRNDSV